MKIKKVLTLVIRILNTLLSLPSLIITAVQMDLSFKRALHNNGKPFSRVEDIPEALAAGLAKDYHQIVKGKSIKFKKERKYILKETYFSILVKYHADYNLIEKAWNKHFEQGC